MAHNFQTIAMRVATYGQLPVDECTTCGMIVAHAFNHEVSSGLYQWLCGVHSGVCRQHSIATSDLTEMYALLRKDTSLPADVVTKFEQVWRLAPPAQPAQVTIKYQHQNIGQPVSPIRMSVIWPKTATPAPPAPRPKCIQCAVELVAELDAYWGTDLFCKERCIKCRGRKVA